MEYYYHGSFTKPNGEIDEIVFSSTISRTVKEVTATETKNKWFLLNKHAYNLDLYIHVRFRMATAREWFKNCPLPISTIRLLDRFGLMYLNNLLKVTDEQLVAAKGIGVKRFLIIKQVQDRLK